MLQVRLDQVKVQLPPNLCGTIQFEIQTRGGSTEFYHLIVDGPRTHGGLGIQRGETVWVSTTEDELEALLFDDQAQPGALRAHGDASLLTALFSAIAKQSGPANPLSLRSKR